MDITKCSGENCPAKEKCKRYTAEASERQSFFVMPPIVNFKEDIHCDFYWGAESQAIFDNILKIMKK